jgi:hypothetical protein
MLLQAAMSTRVIVTVGRWDDVVFGGREGEENYKNHCTKRWGKQQPNVSLFKVLLQKYYCEE